MGAADPDERPTASSVFAHAKEEDAKERTALTLTGADGKFLKRELSQWLKQQQASSEQLDVRRTDSSKRILMQGIDTMELGVAQVYDRFSGLVFNFMYDVLQLASGRDKMLALVQGYAKFAGATLVRPDSERFYMYRGIEESLSDCRKCFRLFKEIREMYKVRRGVHRMQEGIADDGVLSIAATCGFLDVWGHVCSFFFYGYDNLLWAASVGIFRTKEVPKLQREMWQGGRRNGTVITYFGGVSTIKSRKNKASIYRLAFAFTANSLLLKKAVEGARRSGKTAFQGPDDARLFHILELVGMVASFRLLQSKLGWTKMGHARSGLLAMLAAVCGIWNTWRKVRRKKFGTRRFEPYALKRRSIRSMSQLADVDELHPLMERQRSGEAAP